MSRKRGSKGRGRQASKSAAPIVVTIIVVLLLAHSLASGTAMWVIAGALFLGALAGRRFLRIGKRRRRHGVHYRRRLHVAPFVWLNLTRSPGKGWTKSWSVKIGPWSWNSRTDRSSVDLPGGFHWK